MTVTYAELVESAERRYHLDPLFHARVERAVFAVESKLPAGVRLDRSDRDLATLAAACGVVMATRDPS